MATTRMNTASPVTESTPLRNPFWQYSRNKIACEDLLVAAYRDRGFPVTIVRPSHTYDRTSLPFEGGWTVIERMRQGRAVGRGELGQHARRVAPQQAQGAVVAVAQGQEGGGEPGAGPRTRGVELARVDHVTHRDPVALGRVHRRAEHGQVVAT